MAIIFIDGLKLYDNLKGEPSEIIIESDLIDEGMQFFIKNKLHRVAIAPIHGYKLENVNFLENYPFIKHISISSVPNIDGLTALEKLESLHISGEKRKIDFAHFPNLKKLVADWSPFFLNLDKCPQLESLSFYKYKSPNKNLNLLSKINWIKSLTITQSPINSLIGLEHFEELEELELNYCSKLEELCYLESSKKTLTTLLLNHCKSIKNFEYAVLLKNIKTLGYNNCGSISSIKFIKKMSSLEDFRFVNTNVADGDITPCIGLRYVGFINRKHYSHTREQIKSLSNTICLT